MNEESKKVRAAGAAILVNAKVGDFRKGTRNRADRLVKAVRPITDAWYEPMNRAAERGVAELFAEFRRYETEVIISGFRCDDLLFRYAALDFILHAMERKASALPKGVDDLVRHLRHFVWLDVHAYGGEGRGRLRGDAMEVWVDLVDDIDTLYLEYGEVA